MNEQRLMGPRSSDAVTDGSRLGWGGGVLLIKLETFQSLINLFPQIVGERGVGSKKIWTYHFQ
jgi:hypothetical protein